jgi:hypothetical protein
MVESARDQHLFSPGPKRILAVDGGGVRGVVALAFLARLEALLAEAAGKKVLLCDYFDLIGGTSTGAIVAAALALGYSVAEVREYYFMLGPVVFKRPKLRLPGWHSKFDAGALRTQLRAIIGERTLDTPDLRTGLGVMLKRIDRGSAWMLLNNPRLPYWDTPADAGYTGNRHYRLVDVVRASTAAPHFFDPQPIQIGEGVTGLFVDGGLTPHNNPALALFLAAVLPPYELNWRTGVENLTIVSAGAGSFRDMPDAAALHKGAAIGLAVRAMVQQIADNQQLTMTLMTWLGDSAGAWPINSELGDLGQVMPPFGPQFKFFRYDIKLERAWLAEVLGERVGAALVAGLRRFDDPGVMAVLERYAMKAASMQVRAEDWGVG